MNRLQSLAQSSLETIRESRSQPTSSYPLALEFPHRLFTPENYEPRYDYPLLIWLHSQDSSEYELDGLMPHISLRNYVAISLRGTKPSTQSDRKFVWSNSLTAMVMTEELVLQSIDAAVESLSVHPSRVFIAGFGNGGSLAQWIGLRNSNRFAGAISINGSFPHRAKSLIHWQAAKKLPVLSMFGLNSTLFDTDEVCRSIRLAHVASLRYQFAQFPSGDEFDTSMAETANRFMMKIVTGEVSASIDENVDQESISTKYAKD